MVAKWELFKMGATSEAVAIVVAWLMGFGIAPLFMSITRSDKFTGNWWGGTHSLGWAPPITDEMVGRGDFHNFLVGIVFALASGIVVGNGASGGGTNALVGVAISASLLPPVVNSGMCVSFALLGPLWEDDTEWMWDEAHQEAGLFATSGLEGLGGLPMRDQLLVAGVISFALYLMNVLIILSVCWALFRLKGVEFRNTFDLETRDGMCNVFKTCHNAKEERTARPRDQYYKALPGVSQGDGVGALKREKTIADYNIQGLYEDEDYPGTTALEGKTPRRARAISFSTPVSTRWSENDDGEVAPEETEGLSTGVLSQFSQLIHSVLGTKTR